MKKSDTPSKQPKKLTPASNGFGSTTLHEDALLNSQSIPADEYKNYDLDVQDQDGRTPLHIAIMNNNINFAARLVRHGAKIDIKDNKDKTPSDYSKDPDLQSTLESAQRKYIKRQAKREDRELKRTIKQQELDEAVSQAKQKKQSKARSNEEDSSSQKSGSRIEKIKGLVRSKSKTTSTEISPKKVLSDTWHDTKTALYTSSHVNTQDRFGNKPLHTILYKYKAANYDDPKEKIEKEVIKLIQSGADIFEPNRASVSALQICVQDPYMKSAMLDQTLNVCLGIVKNFIIQDKLSRSQDLTAHDADEYAEKILNQKNGINELIHNETFLHKAATQGNMDVVRALVLLGADTEIRNKNGHNTQVILMTQHGGAYSDLLDKYKIDAQHMPKLSPKIVQKHSREGYEHAEYKASGPYSHNPAINKDFEESQTATLATSQGLHRSSSPSSHTERLAQERAEREAMEKRMKESPPQGGFRK